MLMSKILIVEDEDKLRRVLKLYLENEGYIVDEAKDGEEAIGIFSPLAHSLIILDVMLPKRDGWSVLRAIRKESDVPVIMLTARGEEDDKLFGFDLGVDDYVVKPASPREIVARTRAILKRVQKTEEIEEVSIDKSAREVKINGNPIDLTLKEFELLLYLYEHKNVAISREKILDAVWGYEYFGDLRTVDTHIKNIREKLGEYRDYIQTVRGFGYKFEVKK
ncbi:MAG: response regulator transcription factor [Clostridiales bacterium]|nr:response regulator transcription factor [Clostridiales bacterium]